MSTPFAAQASAHACEFAGVLAANAAWRARVVPAPPTTGPRCAPAETEPPAIPPEPVNHTWAELMQRGLAIDSLECPKACGGRLRLVALIERADVVRRILEHLGLPLGGEPAASWKMYYGNLLDGR